MTKAIFARRPEWMPLLLLAATFAVPNLSSAQDARIMGTPELAPAGFRTVDIEAARNRWPLTDPKFLQFSGSGADGATESRLRAIVRNIATDARYSPPTTTPTISEGALSRPPPDTTLWTGRIDAGTFPAPFSSADLTAWLVTRNRWIRRHMGNFRAQGPLLAELANGRSNVGPAIFYISRANAGGQAERARVLIGKRSSVLGEALDEAYRSIRSPGEAGREVIARSFMTTAAGVMVGRGVLDVPETPDAEAERYTVETGQPPWEVRLAIAASVLRMRGQPQPATGLVRLDDTTASALAEPVFAYEGFTLTGIAITQFGSGTGPRGVYEVSALLAFRDSTGRQTLASLVLRFAVADDHIVLEDAEAVPLAAASPTATVWYVPTRALVASNLATADGPGLAKLATQHAVNSATAAPDPVDYYVFAFVNDRLAPDAAVELRVSAGAEGIVGFPGSPVMLNFDGWPVRVHRATFVLGALPAFHFKVVYRRGISITTDDPGTPVLLRAAASVPGALTATTTPDITPPGSERAIHNIIGNAQ